MNTTTQNNTDISIDAEFEDIRIIFLQYVYLKEELHCSDNPYMELIDDQIPIDMRAKFNSCANNKESLFDDFFVSLYFVPRHAKELGVSLKSLRKICLMPATSWDVQRATEKLRYLKHEMKYPHMYES